MLAGGVILLPAVSHHVAAADTRSTLTVSVTVVRHCVIGANAVDAQSTKVLVSCARHQNSRALPTSDRQGDGPAPPPGHVRVGTESMPGDAGTRIVTVDF